MLIWLTKEHSLSSGLSLLIDLLLFAHLEVRVEEAECGNNEEDEEVDDLESDVSLHFHVIPVSSDA